MQTVKMRDRLKQALRSLGAIRYLNKNDPQLIIDAFSNIREAIDLIPWEEPIIPQPPQAPAEDAKSG